LVINLLNKIIGFYKNPFNYFNHLLDTKYFYFHKIVCISTNKLILVFSWYLNLSNIIFKKKIINNERTIHIKTYISRYYETFSVYNKFRKRLFIEILKNSEKIYDKDFIFSANLELSAYSDFNGKKVTKEELFKKSIEQENVKRLNIIREIFENKNILILGPSKVSKRINYEKYDLICICNNNPIDINKKFKGQKGFNLKKVVLFSNVAYFKRNFEKFNNYKLLIREILVKPPIKSSFANFLSPSELMNNDHGPMGIQNMCYTSFIGNAQNIFITGVNAYVKNTIYRDGIKSYKKNLQHYTNNLRRHEPISNFCFLKNLFIMDIVKGDEICSKVFSLNPDEYAKKLDETFNSLIYKPIFSNFRSL